MGLLPALLEASLLHSCVMPKSFKVRRSVALELLHGEEIVGALRVTVVHSYHELVHEYDDMAIEVYLSIAELGELFENRGRMGRGYCFEGRLCLVDNAPGIVPEYLQPSAMSGEVGHRRNSQPPRCDGKPAAREVVRVDWAKSVADRLEFIRGPLQGLDEGPLCLEITRSVGRGAISAVQAAAKGIASDAV